MSSKESFLTAADEFDLIDWNKESELEEAFEQIGAISSRELAQDAADEYVAFVSSVPVMKPVAKVA